MTDIFFADLICETSQSIGTDDFMLDGPIAGHRSFADNVPNGRRFYYRISGGDAWEVGEGRIDEGGLIRAPIVSSNNNMLVDFLEGRKTVHLTVSAAWFEMQQNKALPAHNHAMQNVDGLTDILAAKQDAGDYANAAHSHDINNISGLGNIAFSDHSISIGHNINKDGYAVENGVSLDLSGIITGGFGAQGAPTTGDWDGINSARSGSGLHLMRPGYTNSPAGSNLLYAFGYEYLTKDGRGNMTQFAIPYFDGSGFYGLRFRFNQNWSPWRAILVEGPNGIKPSQDGVMNLGASNRRFGTIFATSGSINTSDENDKLDIGEIPNVWLDAWTDVDWARFKFKTGKRWHLGLVAQKVHAAFARHGIDAFEIGLCCFDKWDAQYEQPLDQDGHPTEISNPKLTQEAGERWGLRYDECFAIEAAWQRRELASLKARLDNISEQP